MSEEIGEFVTANGESGTPSNGNGSSESENGNRRTEGNGDGSARIIDGFESWNPSGPATERIPNRESADSGEPRRTKSGKIDRRTKAGRNNTGTTETSNPVARGGKLISLEKAILSLHDMAAGIFQIPELCLSEQEASALNDAVLDVSKYYVSAFDPKKVAIFNLVTCMGGIYATRVMTYRHRMAMERRSKLSVMPNKQDVPQQGITIEQYLGGNPPVEGAAGI